MGYNQILARTLKRGDGSSTHSPTWRERVWGKSYGVLIIRMEEFIKIATLENEIEARLLDSVLSERDIPHIMRSYFDTAYDGLFQTQKGWGTVSAPRGYHEEVLEILSDLRREAALENGRSGGET